MLPIFRTISVGGVLLAIAILGLALTPPGVSHMRMAAIDAPATGALIDRNKHPEWRQFIIQAALRRADAINALRDLPDSALQLPQIPNVAPPYAVPVFPEPSSGESEKVAGLPEKDAGDAEDITGSIKNEPATIPIEIGETSSVELPAFSPDDRPPPMRMPVSEKPEAAAKVSAVEPVSPIKTPEAPRKKVVTRHPAAAAKPQTSIQQASIQQASIQQEYPVPPPFNILQAIFESILNQPAAAKPANAGKKPRSARLSKPVHTVSQ